MLVIPDIEPAVPGARGDRAMRPGSSWVMTTQCAGREVRGRRDGGHLTPFLALLLGHRSRPGSASPGVYAGATARGDARPLFGIIERFATAAADRADRRRALGRPDDVRADRAGRHRRPERRPHGRDGPHLPGWIERSASTTAPRTGLARRGPHAGPVRRRRRSGGDVIDEIAASQRRHPALRRAVGEALKLAAGDGREAVASQQPHRAAPGSASTRWARRSG